MFDVEHIKDKIRNFLQMDEVKDTLKKNRETMKKIKQENKKLTNKT